MSYTKIYIHIVFGTKRRMPLLQNALKKIIIKHIVLNSIEKGINIDCINAVEDHIHILVRLKTTQTIEKVVHSIKGESSHWCNKNKLSDKQLEWAKGYYAASVDPKMLAFTRLYIRNQELHHFTTAQQYLQSLFPATIK